MRKALLLATLLAIGTLEAQAQKTLQVGAKAGLTLAVLDGQINIESKFKPDFHVGGFVRWRLSPNFALQPELVYSRQGSKNVFPVGPVDLVTKTTLSYLNVPILAKLYVGKVFNFQLGPQFGLLLAGKRKGQFSYTEGPNGSYFTEGEKDVKSDFKGDVALCGGLGVDLPNGLMAAARLNYGVTTIENNKLRQQLRDALGFGGMHNRAIEVSIGYAFGSK